MTGSIAHIVNPVDVGPESDLFLAQPVTFASMLVARNTAGEQMAVRQYACGFVEDTGTVPAEFDRTPDLTRSVADLAPFSGTRRLPLLRDILDRLYAVAETDYLAYTNVDIALMPNFYLAVERFIGQGHDAFVINRRTIPATYSEVADLPLMYAEAGEPHPGFDCFVFRRDLYPGFDLGNVCLGAPHVGQVLLWNLLLTAQHFTEFRALHLTFHIGNDKVWKQGENEPYLNFNRDEALGVLGRIEDRFGSFSIDHPIYPYLSPLRRDTGGLVNEGPERRARPGWVRRIMGRKGTG